MHTFARSSSRAATALLALALLALPQTAAAQPAPIQPAASHAFGDDVVPGEVIVAFKDRTDGAQRAEARRQEGATFKRRLLLEDVELVEVAEGSEKAAAASFARRSDVAYAEPNAIVHGQATPNDTRFPSLYGLHNTGQVVLGATGVADADIDAPEAWNMGSGLGAGVRVAVVDSGVAAAHPDLAANMFLNPGESGGGKENNRIDDDRNGKIDDFRGWDFINNDNNPADDHGHGSHIAGTIAARSNNALGVAGVASLPTASGSWSAPKIIAIKVLRSTNSAPISVIADGLVYAGMMGAKVANVSIGGPGASPTYDAAISSNPNTLYVVGAGNGGADAIGDNNDTSPYGPCNSASTPDAPNKICVAATNSRDELAGFSNFGSVNVDVAAPGVSILSTVPRRRTILSDNFETDIAGRWTTNDGGQTGTSRWNRTTLFATSPTNSLADSPGGTAAAPTQYANNQDSWARNSTALDLTGLGDCAFTLQAKLDTEASRDFFIVEASRTPAVATSWTQLLAISGRGSGTLEAALPAAFSGQTGVFFRFRLRSDARVTGDGVYIDDVKMTCSSTTFDASSYDYWTGTSMATPHVAGAAGFLFTRFPTATVAQVKDKILRSVDRKASLTGKVASGGRLNLYKAAAESNASVTSGILRYAAGAGQTNNVTVTRFTDTDGIAKYRIADPYSTSTTTVQAGSRINPGAGCARADDTTVKCPVSGITRIVLEGGDLDDTLAAPTIAIPVTLDGGAGADALTAGAAADTLTGGPGADRFTAGAGNDTIHARNDDVDALFSCGESTGDSDTVNADLAPDDAVKPSATNCEVVHKL